MSSALPGSVLFACGMNSVRSPMAEALMKHLHGRRVFVDSVGVRVRDIDPFAVEVMKELGVDLSRHRGKTFDALADTSFDLVIALSPEAQHKAVELTRTTACEVEYWPTLDPTILDGRREQTLQAYRDVRDGLLRRIRARFPVPPVPDL